MQQQYFNQPDQPYYGNQNDKQCPHCGGYINVNAVICPMCGCQVQAMSQPIYQQPAYQQPNIYINNTNTNVNRVGFGRPVNKWTAFILCLFFGFLGAHKFYEGRAGMGFLYLCTLGLGCIGWIIDIFSILMKPNPYYVA